MVTGIKVIDLLAPYAKGGKLDYLGVRSGKQLIMELINNIAKAHWFLFCRRRRKNQSRNDLYHEMIESELLKLMAKDQKQL